MKKFPSFLTPGNLEEFGEHRYNRELCYYRTHVYENMMQPSFGAVDGQHQEPNYGINLQNVYMGLFEAGYVIDPRIIDVLCNELKELGWETSVAYGGTMLFVYPPGKKPSQIVNCSGF